VHFIHEDFERCKIMDHHLKIIATTQSSSSCKFLRINAEKAPFFVAKLQIKVLPTVLVFRDGKTIARLVGFEGLSIDQDKPDEWPTSQLQKWIAKMTGAIEYKPNHDHDDENDDESEGRGRNMKPSIWRGSASIQDDDF